MRLVGIDPLKVFSGHKVSHCLRKSRHRAVVLPEALSTDPPGAAGGGGGASTPLLGRLPFSHIEGRRTSADGRLCIAAPLAPAGGDVMETEPLERSRTAPNSKWSFPPSYSPPTPPASRKHLEKIRVRVRAPGVSFGNGRPSRLIMLRYHYCDFCRRHPPRVITLGSDAGSPLPLKLGAAEARN